MIIRYVASKQFGGNVSMSLILGNVVRRNATFRSPILYSYKMFIQLATFVMAAFTD